MHARKAVLGAWSPRDNREIPPLRYDVVRELKARVAPVPVMLNGGLRTPEQVVSELAWADGVMLGREAYHRPMLLAELSAAGGGVAPERMAMLERMTRYARREMARGERLSWITRHMLGLYSGMPGAKEFRRQLSEGARDPERARGAAARGGRGLRTSQRRGGLGAVTRSHVPAYCAPSQTLMANAATDCRSAFGSTCASVSLAVWWMSK